MMNKPIPHGCRSFTKRLCAICLILAASAFLTGCITFLTEIRLKDDGSGTMIQTMTMNPQQMQDMMEGIAKQMGATMTEVKPDSATAAKPDSAGEAKPEPTPAPEKASSAKTQEGPMKEDELKAKAVDLGQGVTFVSAEKIESKTAAGVRVTYAFKDINQLSMNPKPEAALGMAGAGASSKDALKFRFKHLPNGNAVLTVLMPPLESKDKEQAKDKEQEKEAAPPPASPEAQAQDLAMARQMFKGLHMGVAIDVSGKVVKTNSPYVEGSKVTLMDIDFDPLLSDEKAFKSLNEKMDAAKGDDLKTLEVLKGVKGLKVTMAQEISIEFAPRK